MRPKPLIPTLIGITSSDAGCFAARDRAGARRK
jgi:hypothetical protein